MKITGKTYHLPCCVALSLLICSGTLCAQTTAKWQRQFFDDVATIVGHQGSNGWACNGNLVVRFSINDGVPTDTIQPGSMIIDGVHERPDLGKVYIIGRNAQPNVGAPDHSFILVFDATAGTVDTTIGLDGYIGPGTDENHENILPLYVDASKDGRFLSVLRSSSELFEAGRGNFYIVPHGALVLVDTQVDTAYMVSTNASRVTPRFFDVPLTMRVSANSLLDLQSGELSYSSRYLGPMSNDGRYHQLQPTSSTLTLQATDSTADTEPIRLRSAADSLIYTTHYQWIEGCHILGFFDSRDSLSPYIILDVSRNDTVEAMIGGTRKAVVVSPINDSSTALISYKDSTVRCFSIRAFDPTPHYRHIGDSRIIRCRQFEPIRIEHSVFPSPAQFLLSTSWADGQNTRSWWHSYDQPGQYTIHMILAVPPNRFDTIQQEIEVSPDPYGVESSDWVVAGSQSVIKGISLSPDGDLISCSDNEGFVKVLESNTGRCQLTNKLSRLVMETHTDADLGTLAIESNSRITSSTGTYTTYEVQLDAYACTNDSSSPRPLGPLATAIYSTYQGSGPSITLIAGPISRYNTMISGFRSGSVRGPGLASGNIGGSTGLARLSPHSVDWSLSKYYGGYMAGVDLSIDSTFFVTSIVKQSLYQQPDTAYIRIINAVDGDTLPRIRVEHAGSCVVLSDSYVLIDHMIYDFNAGRLLDSIPSFSISRRMDDSTILAVDGQHFVVYDYTRGSERYRSSEMPSDIVDVLYNQKRSLIHIALTSGYVATFQRPVLADVSSSPKSQFQKETKTSSIGLAFPNPCQTVATFELPVEMYDEIVEATVLDPLGRLEVISPQFLHRTAPAHVQWTLELSEGVVRSGVYLVNLTGGRNQQAYLLTVAR